MKLKQFPQKRVLITGAGSGFGRALAMEFARMGWKIGIAEINPERAQQTAAMVAEAGGEPMELSCDVTRPEALEKTAEDVKSAWGGLDILVNNAGVAAAGLVEDTPLETWEWILTLNTKSIIYGCRAFIPMMKQQGGGYIVNMASNAGIASLPEMACYNITKAAGISLSETMLGELSSFNIGVSVVCPTFFKTNLMDQFTSADEQQRKMADAFFKKSKFTPEQIARHTVKCIKKRRFYIITQPEAKFIWYTKRFFPGLYFRGLKYIYNSGMMNKYLGV